MKTPAFCYGIRPAAIAAGLLAGLICTASAAEIVVRANLANNEHSGGALSIENVDGLIALQANDVSLREVLIGIARKCDLQLELQPSLDVRTSLSLPPQPLAALLMRLLRQQSYVLQLADGDDGIRDPGRRRSGTLWVFSDDSSDGSTYRYVDASDQNAEAALLLALEDDDRRIRVEAIHALAAIGGDDVVLQIAAAAGDEDASVREEANNALGGIGGESAIRQLEHSLRDADIVVREAAIVALMEIGGEESVPSLAVALQDPEASMRLEVVESLAEIGGSGAMQLLGLAMQDPDSTVRQAAYDIRAELLSDHQR